MKRLILWTSVATGLTLAACAQTNVVSPVPAAQNTITYAQTTNFLGLVTNGPARANLFLITQTWTNHAPISPRLATNPFFMKQRSSSHSWTNGVFESFVPGSLHHTIWTNFLAHTNGRDLRIWSHRVRPPSFPTNPPAIRWNTNSVLWGMKGLTALSPSWSGEGNPGQVPFTALTRRHAYTRGHGVGPEGFSDRYAGKKVWFLTRDDKLVEVSLRRHVVRTKPGTNGVHRDYTIIIFDRDLPATIEPLRVVTAAEISARYPYPRNVIWPQPIFQTEQGGFVSTGVAPLTVNTWKAGDSGSPNLLPLPGELIFFSGRSTSGPSVEMQEDMDELCRLERLDPKKYQMRKVDLSGYPAY